MRALTRLTCLALLPCVLHAQPAKTTVAREHDALVFDGRIEPVSVARALELLQQPGITRLVITSGGGLVGPALDLAEAVRARGLDVEVPRGCYSSCANYIVPAGRHKLLARRGAVGWHGNMAHVLYLQRTGQGSWPEADMAEARRLEAREAAFYARAGVDGFVAWFGKLPPYAIDEFYSLSPEDMAGFGIRDVTVREPEATVPDALVEPVRVDWPALEKLRPRAAPDS